MTEQDNGESAEAAGPAPIGSGLAAVALALAKKGRGAKPDERLDALLESQRRLTDDQDRLVKLQTENLEQDRALQHRHLALSHRHLALRHFGDGLRIGLQLLAIAFGLIVVIGLGAMVWSAHEDHGLVVEAFSVPPDLVQRGLTGQVVAAQLLDKLSAMQAATNSARPAQSYQNNWGDDLKVEIPETGVSIGELSRYLRQWLGHQTHVTGEVFRTPTGLTVTARSGSDAGNSVSGVDADLDQLLQQSAEAIFRRTQAFRFAVYLTQHGRVDEGMAELAALADGPPSADRVYAASTLSFILVRRGDVQGALARAEEAMRADPNRGVARQLGAYDQFVLGHDEAALAGFESALPLTRANSDAYTPRGHAAQLALVQAAVARYHGDFRTDAQGLEAAWRSDGYNPNDDYGFQMIGALGLNHDASAADAAMARVGPATLDRAAAPWARLEADVALGRWSDAVMAGQALQSLPAQPDLSPYAVVVPNGLKLRSLAAFAYAKAMTGDLAGARALVATTPLDCYDCVRMRGKIAAAGRDWPGAERWFAEAVRQGPSIPMAYSDWGEMLMAKGDLSGAIGRFDLAHQKGPHFADPLKGWGDALARQGRWSDALAKYDEALRYAPAWPELHQARNAAARHPN
jgi:tetratricopeptide (TPR) repeat protein